MRKHHAYFGKQKEISLFGQPVYAYIYVDQYNALKRFSDYLVSHTDENEGLKDKDKDWLTVKYGYFILVSNINTTPAELLSSYFGRTETEVVFKTSKEYLDLLPLCKWTDLTVRGKILHDIIDTIAFLLLRKDLNQSGVSTSDLFGKLSSLMCFCNNKGMVTVETPNKQVKDYYKLFKTDVPAHVKTDVFKAGLTKSKM